MSSPPKVFISYSWTSEEYKASVLQLAEALVDNSIDVILDRWDLHAGHDKYAFMEQSIEKADKVLVLCDKKYTEKANAREGGVGTETAIITPNVYENHEQEKFIPVIMEDFKCVPTYLKSRLGIDFRDGHRDQGFEELLHTIYNKPLHVKPPLGKPPAWLKVSEAGNDTNEMRGKELIEKVILESIGDRRFTSADIAKLSGRTQASVHRILSDMLDKGLIIRAGRGYLIRKQDDIVRIKVCIKVWQEIIDPTTGKIHDEKGLNALDAIMYGPVHEVDEITSDLEKKLLDEFKEIHPNFRFDRYEIQTDEEC